tara:strand:- start:636 stop:857 length:222 start_codon:yes stop_codon:yes gene_type:complete
MSTRNDINSSISTLVSFISENTCKNITEGNHRLELGLKDDTLRKVLSLVESSISESFSLGYSEIESVLKKHNI